MKSGWAKVAGLGAGMRSLELNFSELGLQLCASPAVAPSINCCPAKEDGGCWGTALRRPGRLGSWRFFNLGD